MHGHSPGIPYFVNAKVDFMGDFVASSIEVANEVSPRWGGIDKAQVELRQEHYVREERRRELEFLVNGGNPLDFKFSNVASLGIQSASLTEQFADQYVLSEAKGSFALAASPHGDSVESSGRPALSAGRESNTADNLLLFNENSSLDGGHNVKRTSKRGSAVLEQSLKTEVGSTAKESDDSMVFRLGVKSQAYTRRHRSRPSRDGARVCSSDLVQGNSNRSLLVSPSCTNLNDTMKQASVQEHGVSPVLNSEAESPIGNTCVKVCANDQVDLELDAVRVHTPAGYVKDEQPKEIKEAKLSDTLQEIDQNNYHYLQVVAADIPNGRISPSDLSDGKNLASFATSGFTENIKARCSGHNVNGIDMVDVHDKNLNTKDAVIDNATEYASRNAVEAEVSAVDRCLLPKSRNECSNGDIKGEAVAERMPLKLENSVPGEECKIPVADEQANGNDPPNKLNSYMENSDIQIKEEVDSFKARADPHIKVRSLKNVASLNNDIISKPKKTIDEVSKLSQVLASETSASSIYRPPSSSLFKKVSGASEFQNSASNHSKLAKKACEDAILKEARMIEANWRRAGLLSSSNTLLEKQKKCCWDFVLEEMAWMANDFMQERLWKIHAAAQVCNRIACGGGLQFRQENILRSQKNVARRLCNAIEDFWHSANLSCRGTTKSPCRKTSLDSQSMEVDGLKAGNEPVSIREKSGRDLTLVHEYAIRFKNYNGIFSDISLAEAPTTPDRLHDAGIVEMSWEDQLSEEILFYTVPPGAMQAYRESMEAQFGLHKKKVNNLQHEEEDASICDSVADGQREFATDEDEGETGMYAFAGAFDGSTKANHKKAKHLQQKPFGARLYERGTDMSCEPYFESKSGTLPFIYSGKRPSSTFNIGSIPTKRVRTAARQRVASPFSAASGGAPSKTDFSSGDTNSFKDDQSSLHGGSHSRRNVDVESTMDFERPLQFDTCEMSTKFKKKKPKHLGFESSFTPADAGFLFAPAKRDLFKKRLESQHYDSSGNAGLYGQHVAKKPKLLKQLPETLPEAVNHVAGSIHSPVASQMSNMSNSNKLIKIIANRDWKKNKSANTVAGHSGPGSAWSLFEDQALVVLVHDLGPNWELVSDAINSTLQFKCIHRKPKECKERHKFLMDKSAGDGADSAEDSGSSQPYPSTLPGIPKGSARQLFQRLQGPMEEDALKAHFEKMILLTQQLHSFRRQHDIQEMKQVAPPARSQVMPNYLTGGVLTPLDLCDAVNSSSDVLSVGSQGSHTTGSAIPCYQGSATPILPTSTASAMMNGSSGMVLGTNLSTPSVSLSAPTRDGHRYPIPRQSSLPIDEQLRMQQYSQMLSGRNIQHSNMPVPGALPVGVDHGIRMLPATNGIGKVSGINRGMPIPRPGIQGIGSSGMLNVASPGGMLSATGVGMPNTVNIHPGAVSGPGNPLLRPRDPSRMVQPGHSTEDHRQMMMQEFPMQVSQGNSLPVSSFNSISAPYSIASVSPTIQTFSSQQQQSHPIPQQPHMLGNQVGSQQQAYAIRYAKERQRQQRMLPQSQLPFSGQTIVSQIQNGSQVQPQSQPSSPVTSISSLQGQQKSQPLPPAQSGMQTQVIKQRWGPQGQQQQQPPPPLQKQQQTAKSPQLPRQQSQQQIKPVKGIGRGAMLFHLNQQVDPSHMNSLQASQNQVSEKNLMQQGQQLLYSSNPVLNSATPQSSNHQKMFARTIPQSSKQISSIPSQSDSSNQEPVQIVVPSSQQSPVSPLPLASQQHHQTNQALPSLPKMMVPQDRQMYFDGRTSSSSEALVNQMPIQISECTDLDSAAPVVTTAHVEPQYDQPTTNSGTTPQDNLVGCEIKQGLVQRQLSGNLPVLGHGIGGQWQNQQHRQAASLRQRPSNSGPG